VNRIVTVTLNPAIDETIRLAALRPGQVHRATGVQRQAGGKGVNVASCLADWGGAEIIVTGFIGADNAGRFEALCAAKGLHDAFMRLPGETRTNIKLAHDGDTTDINLPGLPASESAFAALRAAILYLAEPDSILLLAGSLPPGVPPTAYAELIAALRPAGPRLLLDTSGPPLAAALAGPVMPDIIKPNRAELEELFQCKLPTPADIIAAAQELRARGIQLVVVSLGAEGALFVGQQVLHASLPPLSAASTVGAGDAMVAGIIAAMAAGDDPETTARRATAFAAAKLGRAGPHLPSRAIIEEIAGQVTINIVEEART
jgi:1-phosphofructokinase